MKKKIISLCLVVCLLATAIVGGTLAYFTDTDSEKNTFTVGKVDIDVSETNKINGVEVTGNAFANVMPGTEITKTAVVTNNSSETAYVRVVVHLNNQYGLYDMLLDGDDLAVNMAEVMPGWNFTPEKADKANDSGMRYLWTETDTTVVDVLAIDVAMVNQQSGKYLSDSGNYFLSDAEKAATPDAGGRIQLNSGSEGYYGSILTWDDLAWVFYLKMDAGASYTLFEGINVPDTFSTSKELAFFDGLEINVCADAIQSTGFETDKAAFEELEKAHALSVWGLK